MAYHDRDLEQQDCFGGVDVAKVWAEDVEAVDGNLNELINVKKIKTAKI